MAETIAARATPPGRGGVAIVRVSGPLVITIAEQILAKKPRPRMAEFRRFLAEVPGEVIDEGLALFFPAPHSFTGEDVLELHCHGGPLVVERLLQRVVSLGARFAKPGEFSLRAFLNDKIDLAQAEAIADLIDAQTTQAAQSALRSLQGEFSSQITQLVDALIHLRMYVEAAMDFAEEDIDFFSDGKVLRQLQVLISQIEAIKTQAKHGQLLREGMTIAIVGKPNAGKSSLLNKLSGYDSAIVTDIAGTTRDVIKESIQLDGIPLHIMDTAGLRETRDVVEQEGMRRTLKTIKEADHVLMLVDLAQDDTIDWSLLPETIDPSKTTIVYNKIDLTHNYCTHIKTHTIPNEIYISLKADRGVDLLKQHLKTILGVAENMDSPFIARRRHIEALNTAEKALQQGLACLQNEGAGELLAEELSFAQRALGEITGQFTSEDLLTRIFSAFCIGK